MDDEDDLSPPYEIHEKSDAHTPGVSVESDYSEVFDVKEEPEQKVDVSDTATKESTDRIDETTADSTGNVTCPEVEKSCEAAPSLDIPKTPTINYETSEDSDDPNGVKAADAAANVDSVENRAELATCDVPDFDKIAQKIAEDNRDDAKRANEVSEATVAVDDQKRPDDEGSKDKTDRTSSDKRRKDSDKSSSSKSNDSSRDARDRKHSDKKKDKDRQRSDKRESSRSDKDRKSDREHSGHDRHKSSKDRDRSRKSSETGAEHDKSKESGSDRKSSKHHDEKRPKDEKKSSSKSDRHSKHESKDDKRRSSGGDKEAKNKKSESAEPKKQPKNQCASEKLKSDRRSSDRDSSGPSAPSSSSAHSSHRSSSKSERDKHEKHSDKSKHSSSSHKSKKSSSHKHHKDSKSDRSAPSGDKKSNSLKNGLSSKKEHVEVHHDRLEMMLESIRVADGAGKPRTESSPLKRRYEEINATDVLNDSAKLEDGGELKKPKIARNHLEFGKVVKLRKEYKEKMKLLQQQGKENSAIADEILLQQQGKENAAIADDSQLDLLSVPATDSLKGQKNHLKIDNAIACPFKDITVNLSRVDECLSIINGRYFTSDKINNDRNNNDNVESVRFSDLDDEDTESEDNAISHRNMTTMNIEEIIGCRTKDTHITYGINQEKRESVYKKSVQWMNFKLSIDDDEVHYFETDDTGYREEFRNFFNELALASESNQYLQNFSIELRYPPRYDKIFSEQLEATVLRPNDCDKLADASFNSVKYNSEIINQGGEEKSIMMRIKMSHKSKFEDLADDSNKKRKMTQLDEESESLKSVPIAKNATNENGNSASPCVTNSSQISSVATVKRKTLGIKRRISNGKPKFTLNGHVGSSKNPPKISDSSIDDEKKNADKSEESCSFHHLDITVRIFSILIIYLFVRVHVFN